jgi:hypothetical protein
MYVRQLIERVGKISPVGQRSGSQHKRNGSDKLARDFQTPKEIDFPFRKTTRRKPQIFFLFTSKPF